MVLLHYRETIKSFLQRSQRGSSNKRLIKPPQSPHFLPRLRLSRSTSTTYHIMFSMITVAARRASPMVARAGRQQARWAHSSHFDAFAVDPVSNYYRSKVHFTGSHVTFFLLEQQKTDVLLPCCHFGRTIHTRSCCYVPSVSFLLYIMILSTPS